MSAAPSPGPSARARELVRGAYDLHVHLEPDLTERSTTDLALVRRFAEVGLAGFVLQSHWGKMPWERMFESIREAGPEHNALSTDLGQVANPPVDDGPALLADRRLRAGFSEPDVRTMAVAKARKLAGDRHDA